MLSLPSLPSLLRLDAAACAAMSVGLLATAPLAARATGLPEPLLLGAGALLAPCAALMLWTAADPDRRRVSGWLIVAGNALWGVGSLVALAATDPNGLGVAFVLGQAVVVAALAGAEAAALGRTAARA